MVGVRSDRKDSGTEVPKWWINLSTRTGEKSPRVDFQRRKESGLEGLQIYNSILTGNNGMSGKIRGSRFYFINLDRYKPATPSSPSPKPRKNKVPGSGTDVVGATQPLLLSFAPIP